MQASSILAVMAHPDDAELWAGGTLVLHRQTAPANILVASRDEQRASEATEGAESLGVGITIVKELTLEICQRAIVELAPDVVITHRADDVHPDHRNTAHLVLAALPNVVIETGSPKRVYSCDSYESLTLYGKVPGQFIVDITNTFDTKLKALATHTSQPYEHFAQMAERLARMWGARIGRQWGEAFDPIPVLGRLPFVTCL